MPVLSEDFIRDEVADSRLIFQRGMKLHQHGSFFLSKSDIVRKEFTYEVDGNYGDYTTRVRFEEDKIVSSCTCPYPGEGCKHVVAAALTAKDILLRHLDSRALSFEKDEPYLSEEEIRLQALNDREKRAGTEEFRLVRGDTYKGEHLVVNKNKREYCVTLHDPLKGTGHCSCPDYLTNGLGTCKHIRFLVSALKKESGFEKKCAREKFPFVDIYWDSIQKAPGLFCENRMNGTSDLEKILGRFFDDKGVFLSNDLSDVLDLMDQVNTDKRVRIRENLLKRVDRHVQDRQLEDFSHQDILQFPLKAELYPYQKKGVEFGLYKAGVLIGDEMGLGKTLQAIALGILKKEKFGFSKILIVTLASLKEQWKREIEKFSDEKAIIAEGGPSRRKNLYFNDKSLFKITNYEAVLRDITILARFNPDIIILDEAQRIKNFSTKTAEAVKRIPKKHAIVLTGTPLENKLEDVYSIVQFLDPFMLTPLWKFAADHFLIPKKKKSSVAGYKNLDMLNERLKSIVIRRKKEDVLEDLPDEIINNYYIDLTDEQKEIHAGYARLLLPLINKKFLTPVDIRKIQVLLLKMRMVCDSTYLIDRETHISPKLDELKGILDEVVVQNHRKMVIFSEWTTMTFLIARTLSDMNLPFVELSGKIPVNRRQALIDEFTNNPGCRVFLSTDAGGTGLNLQVADCVVNFELPWNPARMNQRIGRINRIGQKSRHVNVINLIAKHSIEEKIFAGIQLKTDLFKGVFDDGPDTVEFSREKRNEMLNRLREMMGEDPELPVVETAEPEEIPEDTPYYLNPEVLGRKEEEEPDVTAGEEDSSHDEADQAEIDQGEADQDNILYGQPPEKIETVLNSGMQFIAGLMEMATGKKIELSDDQDRMVKIDRETGEVTMKFKLPKFI
ncbi:MAG: helicase [Desulfobacterales bacterium RIFOXYA12_FULL_46_15]|nr:MAG: helicase [Desulfobacterales bacterium RIFOXYA12_FULL_46_15]